MKMNMDFESMVLGTLSGDAYVMVNKKMAKKLGFVEAGLLGEFIYTYKMAKQNNEFFEGGERGPWFYLTQPKVEERLGIKRREHENAVKNLVKNSVIEKKKMGLPAKNYYVINWEKIGEILYKKEPEPAPLSDCTKRTNKGGRNVHTREDETYIQERTKCTNIHIYKNDPIKNINKNHNIKIDDDEKKADHENVENFNKQFKQEDDPANEAAEINIFAFKEFVQEFEANFPNVFDNGMYNAIYDQCVKQGLSVITYQEARVQAQYMAERMENGEIIADYAAYFVGGILKKRTSLKSALTKRKLDQESKKEQKRNEKEQESLEQTKVPFYNWLEEDK